MRDCRSFYIDGTWVNPIKADDYPIENPSTEENVGLVSLGSSEDVDLAGDPAPDQLARGVVTQVQLRGQHEEVNRQPREMIRPPTTAVRRVDFL